MQGERAGCRGIIPLPGFGAAPQEPVPQHNRRKRCERPKGRKKRGMLQSAACPPRPSAPHGASVASGPKAARNAACRKARHAPHAPRTPPPQALRAAQRPQETRQAAKRRLHPQSPPTPAHPPNLPQHPHSPQSHKEGRFHQWHENFTAISTPSTRTCGSTTRRSLRISSGRRCKTA